MMRKKILLKRIVSLALVSIISMTSIPQSGHSAYAQEVNTSIVKQEITDNEEESELLISESNLDEQNEMLPEEQAETRSDDVIEEQDKVLGEDLENESDEVIQEDTAVEDFDEDDDPQKVKGEWQQNYDMSQAIPFAKAESEDLSLYYNDTGKYRHGKYGTNYYIRRGIDVSTHQGTIDWKKVKADGVEFALIRVAYRGWGSAGNMKTDDRYVTNIKGAQAAGIPVGAYIFSQATTIAEAQAEAELALSCVKGYSIQLPIIMDFEYADTGSGTGGRLYNANLTKAEATNICNAFCKKVADAGYEAMVYANKDMLTNHLNAGQISNKYKIWIARWNVETGYSGEYSFWQFADNGTVSGISGAVDLDFGYEYIEDEPDTDRYVSDVEATMFDERTQITEKIDSGASKAVNPGTEINLTSDTANTAIFYTMGSTVAGTPAPDRDNGIRYTEPIRISGPTVIKAIAMKSQFKDSAVSTFTFSVKDVSEEQGEVADEDMPEGINQADKVSKISDYIWISQIEDQVYTGKAIRPAFRVYSAKKLLSTPTDYTVAYRNNVNAGTATVIISGRGSYTGNYQTTFNIVTRDLSDAVNEITPVSVAYNKRNQAPAIAVTVDGRKLVLNRDYTLSIVKKAESIGEDDIPVTVCREPGTYIYTVTARENGNYHGFGTVAFTIRDNVVDLNTAVIAVANQNYADWLDFGADINDDSDDCLTDPQDSSRRFALDGSDGGIRPVIVVKDRSGNEIPSSEYDISFKNNTGVGNATVVVAAKSDSSKYVGSKSKVFRIAGYGIAGARVLHTDKSTGVTLDISRGLTLVYTGKAQEPLGKSDAMIDDVPDNIDISITLKRGEEPLKLKKGRDFTVSYLNNIKSGNASVILTGKGRFTGTLRKLVKIQDYTATEGESLNDHIFVQFVDPDKVEKLEDKVNGGSRNVAEYTYIKGGVFPQVKVYYEPDILVTPLTTAPSENAIELVAGTDYVIKNINNNVARDYDAVNARNISIAPQVSILGRRSFRGAVTVSYTIMKQQIGNMKITAADRVCTGKVGQYKVLPVLTDPNAKGSTKLAAGADYDRILVYSLAEANYVLRYDPVRNWSYKRWVAADTVLNPATDTILDNTAIRVTATGIGNYTGTISTVYRMNNLDIASATVRVADQNYTGKAVRPGKSDITLITMKVNGKVQTLNPKDYEITGYQRNAGRGTGIMTIHGLGDYCGYKNVSFRINAKSIFYRIEYKANSSTAIGAMAIQNVFFKGTKLNPVRFRNDGYEFKGWNTKPDGSGDSFSNAEELGTIYPGATLTLYAQWKKIY